MHMRKTAPAVLLAAALLTGCKNSDAESSIEIPVIETETYPSSSLTRTEQTTETTTTVLTSAEASQSGTTVTTASVIDWERASEKAEWEKKLEEEVSRAYQDGMKSMQNYKTSEAKYEGYLEGIKSAQNYYAWIKGDFTATVRALMPDYVTDGETNRVAAVTLFQDDLMLLYLTPEITRQLKPGSSYTFVLEEQGIKILPDQLDKQQGTLLGQGLSGAHLKIKAVREPKEEEYGMNCCRITAEEYNPEPISFLDDEE